MYSRVIRLIAALFCANVLVPDAAFAGNCTPPCANVEAGVKPSSIVPNPDGQNFPGAITTLNLAGNASQQIDLKFGFQIGSQTYTSLFVNENGLVSFGAPIAPPAPGGLGFQSVASLSEFGVPVIAPFYADLASNPDATESHIGNVVVQYGTAVPYANGGPYQADQFQSAVRITWYGLTNNGPTNPDDQVFAQLLLAGDNKGTSSFEFRYGPPDNPGQAGDGSIAGFSLGADAYQFTGPYTNGVPTYFELDNGRLVGSLAAVPEPQTWLLMLIGFATVGWALRRKPSTIRDAAPKQLTSCG